MGEYIPSKRGMELERIFLLPYQLLRKYHWILIKYFILKIIDKPGHGHMRYTQCQITHLENRDNIIYLHYSLIGPIKSGLGKWMFATILPEASLVVVSVNIYGQ